MDKDKQIKKINDTYGHQVGDRVLQFLSKLILDRAREIDLVARWGGEEIIVGLPLEPEIYINLGVKGGVG